MSRDRVIINAVRMVIDFYHKEDIPVGPRDYIWRKAIGFGHMIEELTPERLAALVIAECNEPLSVKEIDRMIDFYFTY